MYSMWNSGGWAHGGYGAVFPLGGILMGAFVIGLIVLLVILISRLGRSGKTDHAALKDHGVDILVERYARGEIDADTFKTMKAELDARL